METTRRLVEDGDVAALVGAYLLVRLPDENAGEGSEQPLRPYLVRVESVDERGQTVDTRIYPTEVYYGFEFDELEEPSTFLLDAVEAESLKALLVFTIADAFRHQAEEVVNELAEPVA